MSVLGKLTDEYFGNDVRDEDGKFLEIRGFKVLVPVDFDEEKFRNAIEDFLTTSEATFVNKQYLDDRYVKIPCGNKDYYIMLNPIDEFRDELQYELTDKQIESMMKFIEFLFDGVDIVYHDGKEYATLIDTSDFDYEMYDAKMNEWESQECWNDIKSWFLESFEDANIIEDDLHGIQYYSVVLTIKLSDGGSDFEIDTMYYVKDMVKWWEKQMEEIRKQGARAYFGLDFDEGESEE